MSSPRLLLFGTPGVGKTALLGALAQAAPALKVDIVDKSGALPQLQKKTYDDEIEPTAGLESYDLHLKPTDKGASHGEDPFSRINVLDCSGQAAIAMLKADQPFARAQTMQKPVLAADTVVLAVDASLTGKQLTDEFQQFGRWLREFYELRGRADVAELPVYLVLTKCDLLAKKDDTFAMWMQRVEEGKLRIDERFRDYLKDQGEGFGTIKLQLWATAIKRPPLADRPAKVQEPFGVAELFRQCIQSAHEFQVRRHTAQSRLQNIVAGLVGLIALLLLLMAFLFEFQPETTGMALEEKAIAVLPRPEATTVERLQGGLKKLEERQAKLIAIRADASFQRLPTETQDAVNSYHDEITKYIELYDQSQRMLKLPYLAKNEKEFKAFEKAARKFTVPKEWHETSLGKRAARSHAEYDAIDKAVQAELAWLRAEIRTNYTLYDRSDGIYKKLRDKKNYDDAEIAAWRKLKAEFDTRILKRPEPRRQDLIPGVSRLHFEDLGRFAAVKESRLEWGRSQELLRERSEFIQERIRTK